VFHVEHDKFVRIIISMFGAGRGAQKANPGRSSGRFE